jgi:hypothetical protein
MRRRQVLLLVLTLAPGCTTPHEDDAGAPDTAVLDVAVLDAPRDDSSGLDTPGADTASGPIAFYVSASGDDANDGTSAATAFRTLERAQVAWRSVVATSGAIVHVCGMLERSAPLVLDASDTPPMGAELLITSCPGDPGVLAASTAVEGFARHPPSTDVYFASVPATARPWLFSEGTGPSTVRRSRTPNVDDSDGTGLPRTLTWVTATTPHQLRIPHTFTFGGTSYTPLAAFDGETVAPTLRVELVASVRWVRDRLPILAYTRSGSMLFVSPTMEAGAIEGTRGALSAGPYAFLPERPFVLEGDYPDVAGEYAFDHTFGLVYVKSPSGPPAGLRVANGLSTLVRIAGAARVTIRDVTFAHTSVGPEVGRLGDGVLPDSGITESRLVSGSLVSAPLFGEPAQAALVVEGAASDVLIENARFVDLAGVALVVTGAANDVRIEHSHFRAVERNAITIWGGPDRIEVHDNVFEEIGMPIAGDAVGVLAAGTFRVSRNTFRRVGGRAIYAFGDPYAAPIACCVDGMAGCAPAARAVTGNRIEGATLMATDLGAINTGMGNIRIQGNVIVDTQPSIFARPGTAASGGEGLNKPIYLDIGTRGACVTGNVASGGSYFLLANCQAESTIRDNYTGAFDGYAALGERRPLFAYAACDVLGPTEDMFILPRRPPNYLTCTADASCAADDGSVVSNNDTGADPVTVAASAGATWTP